jgi:hypothetical protein
MSRNVYRLNNPVKRPMLSWSTAPRARESLLALTQWLLIGSKTEAVQIGSSFPSTTPLKNPTPQEADHADLPLGDVHTAKTRKPNLKVVMVRDAQNPQAPAPARLVISGRMADVCAELDRLAA